LPLPTLTSSLFFDTSLYWPWKGREIFELLQRTSNLWLRLPTYHTKRSRPLDCFTGKCETPCSRACNSISYYIHTLVFVLLHFLQLWHLLIVQRVRRLYRPIRALNRLLHSSLCRWPKELRLLNPYRYTLCLLHSILQSQGPTLQSSLQSKSPLLLLPIEPVISNLFLSRVHTSAKTL
jgi:hypothetical protein